MNPLTSSIIGLFFLGIGLAAALIMLDLKGRQKDRINIRKRVISHRVLGYLFFAIYLFMLAVMITRVSRYQEELAPRLIVHLVIALIIFPLAGLKILVVRRFKLFTSRLIFLGSSIFILAFVFIVITAGYYFLYSSHVTFVSISDPDILVMDENIGRHLVISKCSKCHSLERIYKSSKSELEWQSTLERMVKMSGNPDYLSETEKKEIITFLFSQKRE